MRPLLVFTFLLVCLCFSCDTIPMENKFWNRSWWTDVVKRDQFIPSSPLYLFSDCNCESLSIYVFVTDGIEQENSQNSSQAFSMKIFQLFANALCNFPWFYRRVVKILLLKSRILVFRLVFLAVQFVLLI